MLSCKQTTELCSAELDRPLRLGEKLALRTHLLMCSGCTNYRDQLKLMRRTMQAYAQGEAASDPADPADDDN